MPRAACVAARLSLPGPLPSANCSFPTLLPASVTKPFSRGRDFFPFGILFAAPLRQALVAAALPRAAGLQRVAVLRNLSMSAAHRAGGDDDETVPSLQEVIKRELEYEAQTPEEKLPSKIGSFAVS